MREFLRTGHFGPINLGDSIESLRTAFGEPDVTGGRSLKYPVPRIWLYGDIEFHLSSNNKSISLIFCDTYSDRLRFTPEIPFDCWFFKGNPLVETVEEELREASIGFHRGETPHEPTTFVLRLDSGIALLFSDGTPGKWPGFPGLFGFSYSIKD